MTELTQEQLRFLHSHKIQLSNVFDGTGMAKVDYQKAMTDLEKSFVYGVTPCLKGGHTLRTKAGHCIQCDVRTIAFQLRSKAKAHIYIAGSYKLKLIKVGSSLDIDDRLHKLNEYKYGGADDWSMLASAYQDKAGRIENYIHGKLKQYNVKGSYIREGRKQQCYELFQCNFDDAYKPLKALAGKSVRIRCASEKQAQAAYSFR